MRMRSPKLYEHMTKHDILDLPRRICLKRAIQLFYSGFGFNPRVFKGLQEKTKDMDEHCRHGIIVFYEMKLSEQIDVKPSGSVEGFVDLGQFETEGSGKELADHGLVVLFQPFTGKWMQILGIFAAKDNIGTFLLLIPAGHEEAGKPTTAWTANLGRDKARHVQYAPVGLDGRPYKLDPLGSATYCADAIFSAPSVPHSTSTTLDINTAPQATAINGHGCT
ncbi:hypothetical protein HPB51_025449 [Rhipicephalus microplus]|uniref:Transposable element P transposase-like RNase H domain-containing protein n=1 Tax=Rhipicephalus microplus TaxID=6941 RepID=A0A9J6EJH8_RHIMP|nr:hypothetical protein HPB51_025449 [Rhipicephalus microplus]